MTLNEFWVGAYRRRLSILTSVDASLPLSKAHFWDGLTTDQDGGASLKRGTTAYRPMGVESIICVDNRRGRYAKPAVLFGSTRWAGERLLRIWENGYQIGDTMTACRARCKARILYEIGSVRRKL